MHSEELSFIHIRCMHKVHIAIGSTSSEEKAYETFLKQNNDKFNLIFIDGIHTEDQVLNDIAIAYKCLVAGGIIIIHDCLPPDAWHQRELEDYHEGENWNGTTWKAALRIFNQSQHKCSIIDTDWGCGIIDTSRDQAPANRDLPETLNYELHFKWLLEHKISVAAYLREQVKVFYHLACMGNWQEVFREQMLQLKYSGFQDVNLTVLGTTEDFQAVNSIYSKLNIKTNIIFHAPDLHYFETPALLAIEKYAREKDGYVLYLHSKGVSNPEDKTKIKWRRLMMRELLEKWESCVLNLPHYDAIGVNWRDMRPTSHFCGNFWYASTRYLRKLADFNIYYDNPLYSMWDRINDKRLGCEFWIGSGRDEPRVLSLVCRNVDFCNHNFWKDK